MQSVLTKKQTKTFRKDYTSKGKPETIIAKVRFDDECGNGHNTFSITADIFTTDVHRGETTIKHENGKTLWLSSCGCQHEEVAKHFPDLAPLIKWHLTSSDGPMHGIANTIYHAGDKDHNGKRKGEPWAWDKGVKFDAVPIIFTIKDAFWKFLQERQGTGDFQVIGFTHAREPKTYGTHYTFVGFGDNWYDCPFRSKPAADEFCEAMNRCKVEFVTTPTLFSEGKERELDAARRSAVWLDATDEELTAPGLKERLEARLPALLEEFKAAVESLGFIY